MFNISVTYMFIIGKTFYTCISNNPHAKNLRHSGIKHLNVLNFYVTV